MFASRVQKITNFARVADELLENAMCLIRNQKRSVLGAAVPCGTDTALSLQVAQVRCGALLPSAAQLNWHPPWHIDNYRIEQRALPQ